MFVRYDCPNIFLTIGSLTLTLFLFRFFTLFLLSFLPVIVLVLSMTF